MISFVDSAFDDDSFPIGVFKDLVSLKFFDFFGNKINMFKKSWFYGGWGQNILRLAFWNNDITTIEADAFESLTSLEKAYLHSNP